jgi:hypothetical protein
MTPRRIVLALIWLVLFGAAYSAYDKFLGWVDGLPLLPDQMLIHADSSVRPPSRPTSPTTQRLWEAFGPN